MDRLREVQTRWIDIAKEAVVWWQSTRMARGRVQVEIARRGPLRAKSPARAWQFRLENRCGQSFRPCKVSFQLCQDRDRSNHKNRSDQQGFGDRSGRFEMAPCWQRARFSNPRSERSLRALGINDNRRKIAGIMSSECLALNRGKSIASMRMGFWRRYTAISRFFGLAGEAICR